MIYLEFQETFKKNIEELTYINPFSLPHSEYNIIFFRDILFEKIYDRFSYDPVGRGTFLECLEPYILNDALTSVTPSVMKDFVDHYAEKGMLQEVEACIVHLEIASLDIHQVKL